MKTQMQEKILTIAESLIQKMGYNAFSYKDIALAVGIKTSSIHYYYPAKEDLAEAVIEWQLEALSPILSAIQTDPNLSLQDKLRKLVDLVFSLTIENEMKMCLGGMLASDVLSVPEKVRAKARQFFNILEQWIIEILTMINYKSKSEGLYAKKNLPKYLLLQLEGSLLMSRLYQDFTYAELLKQFITTIK